MSNMSYCRFENTSNALSDCIGALENREIESDREKKKAKQLLNDFLEFCEIEGIIEGFDIVKLNEVIAECQ